MVRIFGCGAEDVMSLSEEASEMPNEESDLLAIPTSIQ